MRDDPVDLLEAFADRVYRRNPQRLTPTEVWAFIKVLTAVAERRPDWVAGLPEADQRLFHDARTAALAAFEGDRVH
jgi:hypothetical protein